MPPVLPAAEPRLDLTAASIGIVAFAAVIGAPGTVIWCLLTNGWM